MLNIVAKFIVKEDKIEEFKYYAKELTAETIKEKGCISYHLLQDINDIKIITFVEEWEDQESIDRHNNSKHFVKIVPKLIEILEDDPVVNINSIVL